MNKVAKSKSNALEKEIKLVNGVIVKIPVEFKYAKCKGCEARDIIWAKTKNDKMMPIRWDELQGWISHFSDCPNANKFRKKEVLYGLSIKSHCDYPDFEQEYEAKSKKEAIRYFLKLLGPEYDESMIEDEVVVLEQ